MNETRLSHVKKNIVWAGVSNVLSTLLPFILRAFLIHYLGSEYLGLNSLYTSIIYMLNAADFGISNAFAYRLYKPIATHDTREVCRLLYFYRKVYTIIGGVIFAAGLIVLPFIDRMIKSDVPDNVNIYVCFLIYLINAVLSYIVFAYKELILLANQRRDYVDIVACICISLMYSLQIYFVMQRSYYGYLVIMPLVTILANVIKSVIVKKKYPEYVCQRGIDKGSMIKLFHDVISVAVYRFRDISRNAFDSITISAFVGLVALSNYQNYYTVLCVPLVLGSILVNAITPSMGNCVASENKRMVYDVYKIFIFVHIYITGWFAICYGGLIQDFIILWLGNEVVLSNTIVFLFVLYYYVRAFCEQTKMFREAAGLWNKGRVFAGIEMAMNLILNVVLVYLWGISGVMVATILTILFINIPFENYIIYHDFFECGIKEIAIIYGKAFMWFIIAGIITGAICSHIVFGGYKGIVIKAIICIVIPIVLFFVQNYKTEELKYIFRRFGFKC